jgi:type IV pilus assembly protein PilE
MRTPRRDVHVPDRGVTLIELMIVLVVVAIIAAIALPSYRAHVVRSQRTSAISALMKIQVAQEKFFLQNGRYSQDLSGDPASGGLGIPAVSEGGLYDLSISTSDPFAYVARARPRPGSGPVDDDRCAEFTINQNGTRRALSGSTDTTADCWR